MAARLSVLTISPRALLAGTLLTGTLLTDGAASAQVNWDASAQVGAMKRLATGGDSGAPAPGLGPSLELRGHVALWPMVRLGAYLATDLSPAGAEGPRTFAGGGLHVRVSPPVLPWPWRTWLFAGFGDASAYDAATRLSGGLLEVPVGLGLGRKLTRRWMLFGELGARFGVAFYGPMYEPARSLAATGDARSYVGKDAVALSLSVGLSLEP